MVNDDKRKRRVKEVVASFESGHVSSLIANFPNKILSHVSEQPSGLATIDNSSFHYASDLMFGLEDHSKRFQKDVLYGLVALGNIVECVILFDKIVIGPDDCGNPLYELLHKEKVLEAFDLDYQTTFGLLGIAKQRAIADLKTKPEIFKVLSKLSENKFSQTELTSSIKRMTPQATHFSPHHWDELSEGELLQFDINDVTSNFLNNTLINTFAIDPSNKGRYWGQDQFFALIRGRGFDFPRSSKELNLLHLASVLIRTNYYLLLSGYSGATYYADYNRAEVLPAIIKPSKEEVVIIRKIISNLEQSEQERNEILNRALGIETFSFSLPILLTNILLQASNKNDIVKVALQMRSSGPAKRFRKWSKTLQSHISLGKRAKVEEDLAALKDVGIEMSKEFTDKRSTREVDIAPVTKVIGHFNPLLSSALDLADLPAKMILTAMRKRHFAFLSTLRKTNANAHTLQSRISELFGQEFAA